MVLQEKTLDFSKNQLDLRLLKTLNLTLIHEPVPPLWYERSYKQFYQYYTGYGSIFEGLGFCE
ncbi:MAG: hypothetical protein FWH37_07485 [Candidatus Bathyarchaeota archaeon]|nr:hypothetical protein [Candidatus Termiticorpusculum sp.]